LKELTGNDITEEMREHAIHWFYENI
jgi:hypothetical protein